MPNYLDSKLWKWLIIMLTHVVDFDNDSDIQIIVLIKFIL